MDKQQLYTTPEARQKVCERVWFDLNATQRHLMQLFWTSSEFGNLTYTNEEALNRAAADLKAIVEKATGSSIYADVFWADKMKEAEDSHRSKLNAEV